MTYFIQTTIYAALLHLVYLLFMKNRSSHAWSRAYLLMNMVLPFVLPFVKIDGMQSSGTAVADIMLPVLTVGSTISAKAETINMLPIAYGAVCFTLLGYLLAQLVQLILFVRRHEAERRGNIQLVRGTGMGPGSWFSYVFIPENEAGRAVLDHEAAHVRYKHSYDIVLTRLLLCFAWPNVMLWLILKELKTVHEFQADAVAVSDREDYSKSLLNELFHTKHFALSHTYFHHPIKRRITMLQNKNRTGKMRVVTTAALLLASLIYLQNAEAQTKKTDQSEALEMVTKMPEFDGDLMAYLGKSIKYPKYAKDKKIEGRVIAKFFVNERGEIEDITVVKSPHESLSASAVDVIRKMPRWKPGEKSGKPARVAFTLPISYKLK